MSDYGRIDPGELDRHITGNYGEDQFKPRKVIEFAGVTLEEACGECESEGFVQHPAWADWFNRTGGDETKAPMPEPEIPEEMPCPECEGRGSVMTEAGAALAEFIRRYTAAP